MQGPLHPDPRSSDPGADLEGLEIPPETPPIIPDGPVDPQTRWGHRDTAQSRFFDGTKVSGPPKAVAHRQKATRAARGSLASRSLETENPPPSPDYHHTSLVASTVCDREEATNHQGGRARFLISKLLIIPNYEST